MPSHTYSLPKTSIKPHLAAFLTCSRSSLFSLVTGGHRMGSCLLSLTETGAVGVIRRFPCSCGKHFNDWALQPPSPHLQMRNKLSRPLWEAIRWSSPSVGVDGEGHILGTSQGRNSSLRLTVSEGFQSILVEKAPWEQLHSMGMCGSSLFTSWPIRTGHG